MILIDEYFRNYPARKKVAEFLLRTGVSVRDGSFYLEGAELSPGSMAKALGVNRKVVYLTAETIEFSKALSIFFQNLRPGLRVEAIAPVMGWEALQIEVSGSPGEVLKNVLGKITAEGNDVIAVNLRNLPGESARLSVVLERPLGGRILQEIGRIPGVTRILVKTPERDKTKLVCTFCEVRYCPKKISGGNVED